ncbi:hypothetical protein ACQ4PT_033681 [Festuca glaucescens]
MSLPKVASPKAGDMKVVPVMVADEVVQVQEMHVLAMDNCAVIAKILRGSKYRGSERDRSPRKRRAVGTLRPPVAVTTMESVTRTLELLDLELITNVNMIIMDYWMVGMSGYELLKRIKINRDIHHSPISIPYCYFS